jgi:hypothetical protein
MPLYTILHNLLNVLVQIANRMGLQKERVFFSGNWRQDDCWQTHLPVERVLLQTHAGSTLYRRIV